MPTTFTYEEALKICKEYFGDDLPAKVCVDKYLLRNKDNELVECSPVQIHKRLAKEFARIQAQKYKNTKNKASFRRKNI